MRRTGPRTRIRNALHAVNAAITRDTNQNSMYSRGLASESYAGGYRDALSDVLLALDGNRPHRRDYWKREVADGE